MARGGSRRKGTNKKSALDYKEVYDELVNQSEIPIKMTATKDNLNNLGANFDRKMLNVLLEQLQNTIARTFSSNEINHRFIYVIQGFSLHLKLSNHQLAWILKQS